MIKIEYNFSVTISQFHNFIMMAFKFKLKTLFERSVKTNVVPSWRPSQSMIERTKRITPTILEIEVSPRWCLTN